MSPMKWSTPKAERFFSHVAVSDGCHEWTGHRKKNRGGYGLFWNKAKKDFDFAHRVAWELAYGNHPCLRGPMLPGICVLHRCDNPPCVRHDHLFLGTRADNNRDMAAKGRAPYGDANGSRLHPGSRPRGVTHWRTKVSEEQVHEIKRRRAAGERPRFIAADYGVTPAYIWNVVHGKRRGQMSSNGAVGG